MKKNNILIVLIFTVICSITNAQTSEENIVKNNVLKLLNLSKEKSYEEASKSIVYKGDDKARYLKTSYNANNSDELNQVKRICKKISALIELSSKYEFGKYYISKEDNLTIYNQELVFISGEEKLTTTFKFIKTELGYLLYDMN
ncbi:MAG: hypothetical protein N2249_05945 [Melioribacter sp.]|nr:hypothetical protein [Melioribacter sp.]